MTKTELEQIELFWQQVSDTISDLLGSRVDNHFDADSLLSHYQDTLKLIDSNLTFHFESEGENDAIEMVFGCDGYAESIDNVLAVIKAAPRLDGVCFKAFNARYDPVPLSVHVDTKEFLLDDFWFAQRVVDGYLHIEIYVKRALSSRDFEQRSEAIMIFLDALIGEYEMMTKVSTLEWLELPPSPEDFSLQPLRELRNAFDRVKTTVRPIGMVLH